MVVLISILAVLAIAVGIYMQHPKFGAKPTGKRLEKIQASPNYKNGSFVNRSLPECFFVASYITCFNILVSLTCT